ncbi:MAG: ADP-forming succinate--CoA ligase subunit beta [Desulfobulbaceae bacterium]|nr:ADP-forming succinate--CoA ligase subunit beta [Desulfobulbaceae bacterium]
MKIHEYQAKALLHSAGLPVPRGITAATVESVLLAADQLAYPVAIKAQVHAGGRGRAGGIAIVHSRAEAGEVAGRILGMTLRTEQTGTAGQRVSTVLVEQGLRIRNELYLSIVPDRGSAGIMIIASREGGMNIEDVAAARPDSVIRVAVNPLIGIQQYHLRLAAFGLGLQGTLFREFTLLLQRLFHLVVNRDLLLAEINPLAVTEEGCLTILDAKLEIDSNALFRHPDLAELYDPAADDPLEAEAGKHHLNYIRLGGSIGTMVNGAGLAMATMDMIKQAGGEPANFLDVGGGASADMIENGFRIILSDPRVQGVLINIFGGILRCDVLARGMVAAGKKIGLTVPVVVRMEGTNVDLGRKILAESGLNLLNAVDLEDAAGKIAAISAEAQ